MLERNRVISFCLAALLTACDGSTDPGVNPDVSCNDVGVTHTGVVGDAVWRAADGPHEVRDTVHVNGELSIEAGAILCAGPGSLILVAGRLAAVGTSAGRIRFIATDTALGWKGILARHNSSVRGAAGVVLGHVDAAHAGYIAADSAGSIQIDHSSFRTTGLIADGHLAFLTIRQSTVEDANVQIAYGVFAETTIRRGSLHLRGAQGGTGAVTINGGRIEDSHELALVIGDVNLQRFPNVTVARRIQIVGSRGGIGEMRYIDFDALWPGTTTLELANNVDRAVFVHALESRNVTLNKGPDWVLTSAVESPEIVQFLIERGTTIRLQSHFQVLGSFQALGTANERITITAPTLCSGDRPCGMTLRGGLSRLDHVDITDAYLAVRTSALLEHVASSGQIALASPAARIADSEIHDVSAYGFGTAALELMADSIRVERVVVRRAGPTFQSAISVDGSHVQIVACDITDNHGDGIRVVSGSNVQVRDCNIERNGAFGINNMAALIVNATANWWGDPDGPGGSAGDGVSGSIDYSSHRTTPRP